MNGFVRADLAFSLCGLNCGLCPMKLDGHCPGCGGGAGNQSCKIARCSLEHGSPAYCFQCGEFPCGRYEGIDEYDSFITHQKRLADMERARAAGLADYQTELGERRELLDYFLANCNDGRRKTLFYLAANLLSLKALQEAREQARAMAEQSPKERGTQTAALLQASAAREGVLLKLRRKPKQT